jgi:Uma2 family endonuclease
MAIPDLRRPWTPDDLLDLPEDSNRYEIVDGELRVSPGPTWHHNGLALDLAVQLRPVLPPHLSVVAPAGGIVIPRGLLIADLAVVDAGLLDVRSHQAEPGLVHVVCEVWSPSTGVDDVREKTRLYAEAGIGSYWRVEIEPQVRIVVQELHDGRYVEVAAGSTVTVQRPVQVELSLR